MSCCMLQVQGVQSRSALHIMLYPACKVFVVLAVHIHGIAI